MITIRKAEDIYRAEGRIENGTFTGPWQRRRGRGCDQAGNAYQAIDS